MQLRHTHLIIRRAIAAGARLIISSRHHVLVILFLLAASIIAPGCQSPTEYRLRADQVVHGIIQEKQKEVFDRADPVEIERPVDILRRRLLET